MRELGAEVIDADALAREVVAVGTPGLAAVVEEFGPQLLGPDGNLDRPAMGRIVFNDAEARARLESIVHPLIFARVAEVEEQVPEGSLVVHDLPLLAESGRSDTFDAVIVVDTARDQQIERMRSDRGWSAEEALSRINAQAAREDRLAIATHVIDNNADLAALRARVVEIHTELTALTGAAE